MKGNEKLFRKRFMVFVLTCSLLAGTFAFSGERVFVSAENAPTSQDAQKTNTGSEVSVNKETNGNQGVDKRDSAQGSPVVNPNNNETNKPKLNKRRTKRTNATRGEGDYSKIELKGLHDVVGHTPGKKYVLLNDVSMVPVAGDWLPGDEFRVAVTGVDTPSGGSYTYHPGDTEFTPTTADNGKTYVIHFEIQKKVNGNWVSLDNPVTGTKTVEVFAVAGVKPLLDSNDAEVTKLFISELTDGTGPFDADNNPGNDKDDSNKIVRSFDSITYQLGYSTKVKTSGIAYNEGYINFEMTLPYKKDIATFDTDAMGWMATDKDHKWEVVENPDGTQTFKALKRLKAQEANESAIPGSGEVPVSVSVKNSNNGQIIKPIFKAWMDYNNPATDAKEAKVPEVKVTAEPNYNVQLKSGHDQYVGTIANFDFSQGNNLAQDKDAGKVYGRMQGVGVTIQLRNQAPAKGIRGIEFPKGNIEFDMDVSSVYKPAASGSTPKPADLPLLWTYGPTVQNSPAGPLQDGRPFQDVYGRYSYAPIASPENKATNTSINPKVDGTQSCWDGGKWDVKETSPGKYHVTIKDYKINPDWFPNSMLGRGSMKANDYFDYKEGVKNEGCFSAGSFIFVVPFGGNTDTTNPNYYPKKYGNGTVEFTVKDSGMKATSVTGQNATAQINPETSDDFLKKAVNLVVPGDFATRVFYKKPGASWFTGTDGAYNDGDYKRGTDAASIGSEIQIQWGAYTVTNGDAKNAPFATNYLLKFDDEALEIDTSQTSVTSSTSHLDMWDTKDTYLYAAKSDGSGWKDDTELDSTTEEKLVYYKSLADLKAAGKVCVGIMVESRKKSDKPLYSEVQDVYRFARFKVKKNTSIIGKSYMTSVVANVWTKDPYDAVLKKNGGKFPSRLTMSAGQTVNTDAATKPTYHNYNYYDKYKTYY